MAPVCALRLRPVSFRWSVGVAPSVPVAVDAAVEAGREVDRLDRVEDDFAASVGLPVIVVVLGFCVG